GGAYRVVALRSNIDVAVGLEAEGKFTVDYAWNPRMDVRVSGLPPHTEFDLFVIQVPHGPFGMSWYQGDIETDDEGEGHGRFIGRFSIETFIVAPGSQPAPVVHEAPLPDAATNPVTAPVHTFHLSLWFNSPEDGATAGCPGGPTPFNGDHTAGVQVLNTANFPDLEGPLSCVNSPSPSSSCKE